MTGRNLAIAAIVVLAALALLASGSLFTVGQNQQALVLQFQEPVAGRGLVRTPGLHFKVPLIESVIYFDKRILNLETPKQEVLAADNQRIDVDAFLRYHITDPLKFFQTVGTVARAENQLSSVLNSATRRILGEANLQQIVRDDRAELMVKIRSLVAKEAEGLGVTVNDVRLRRADLPKEISEKVFGRMQSERAREAADYRAQGSEQAQTLRAKADRDKVVLLAAAQQQADQVRGEGEAARNGIFAEAFGKDPDFFAFYRSMQAYEAAFKSSDTRLVLSPKSDFFRYFGSTPSKQEDSPAAGK